MPMSYKTKLSNITSFVFDIDGVFTDGSVLVSSNGELLRRVSVKDGFAVKEALRQGFRVCLISGGTNEGVRSRFKALGVTDIYMGAHEKMEPLHEFLDGYAIDPKEVLYMGDDIPDLPPMSYVGLPSCPQNAVAEVKAMAEYISHKEGGQGCVRDVIEQVLKVQGKWLPSLDAQTD
ncbi:MAG: HAD-IIIA family hydrolase [Flavobacteriaceae bacterium]|nr:HAD-IIIA family hydrolase [Flavobacteriaceae bacterium LSUCC0859]